MKTTEIPIELFLPPSRGMRSPGVHVSGIIRCLATESGILKPDQADDLSLTDVREIKDQTAILRISIGLAWEEYYISEVLGPLMGVVDHPGELEVDGIYMSPDGESIATVFMDKMISVIHEVKATYKSTKTVGDLSSQWMWLAQVMAYCKGARTTVAMLHVLFLCGDYKYPITPQVRCWKVEFTEEEINQNWDLLRGYMQNKLGETA
jgi:hypothetical protein